MCVIAQLSVMRCLEGKIHTRWIYVQGSGFDYNRQLLKHQANVHSCVAPENDQRDSSSPTNRERISFKTLGGADDATQIYIVNLAKSAARV